MPSSCGNYRIELNKRLELIGFGIRAEMVSQNGSDDIRQSRQLPNEFELARVLLLVTITKTV